MSFDSSRFTFNPWNDFFGVVMQQGRVQVDADWNEWLGELSRRIQAGALDTLGRAVVPQTTPHGFEITLGTDASGATEILIGPGRMYVDGLLTENHGQPAPLSGGWTPGNPSSPTTPPAGLNWDTALAELVGANPIPYPQQPYLPNSSFPSEGGPYLVYLDVWQRAVTFIEDPDLVEKAVGVDTTGRIQTVWQVKWINLSQLGGGISCSTPDSDIPEWAAVLLPPSAQLSTGVVQSPQSGPCCLAPNTGYTGLENQLYRVEIHQGDPLLTNATFKWSRDNASVATGVTSIAQGGTSLVVQSTGRDAVLRFSPNDWVEITDDWQELQGLPGSLRQIKTVTDASSTITLYDAISTVEFPVDANGLTDPGRHTRMLRWDQKGKIYQSDLATVWADLDVAGATGDIPVPPAGTTLVLEDGVTITFNQIANAADFKTGQFWNFAARSTDGTVEFLDFAPPRGIHHHYARLSVVDLAAGTASNCRTPWPPNFSSDCCGCTINLKPGDLTGNNTFQSILDKLQKQPGPSTICLAPGKYVLTAPLRLTADHRQITIEACQSGTALIVADDNSADQFTDGLLVLDQSLGITLRGIAFELPATTFKKRVLAGLPVNALDPGMRAIAQNLTVSIGLRTVNISGLTVEDCVFDGALNASLLRKKDAIGNQGYQFTAAILASGLVSGIHVEGSTFKGNGDFSAAYLHTPSAAFVDPSQFFKNNDPAKFRRRQPAPAVRAAESVSSVHSILNFFARKSQQEAASTQPAPAAATETAAAQTPAESAAVPAASPAASPAAGASAPQAASSTGVIENQSKIPISSISKQRANPNIAVEAGFDVFVPSSTHAEYGGSVLPGTLRGAIFSNNTFSGLSIAALVLASAESVDFLNNQLRLCHGGFWLLTPGDALLLAAEPQELGAFGLAFAIAYPLPSGDSATLTTISAAPDPVRIYDGVETYTDSNQKDWLPEGQGASVTVQGGAIARQPQPPQIIGTQDQLLYQSERWGTEFTYTFSNLPAGFYTVTLKLAEIFWTAVGQRVFNVSINGTQVLSHLDLIADSGVSVADDQTFLGIPSVGGSITITFSGTSFGSDPDAKSGAIEILPQWSADFLSAVTASVNTGGASGGQTDDLLTFFLEITQLAQQAYATEHPLISSLRVEDNQMQRLTSLGLLVIGDDQVQTARTGSLSVLGNQMSMTSPFTYQPGGFNAAGESASSFSTGAVGFRQSLFSSVVAVFLVTRCVVSNNMIVNESFVFSNQSVGRYGRSLLLMAGTLHQPNSTVPPPEISVMANVFQGGISVQPSRQEYLNNTSVPFPMNRWEFLNTVTL